MGNTSLLHWVVLHGAGSPYDIADALDEGKTRQFLAQRYETDNGQFSRFLNSGVIITRHFVSPEADEFLKKYSQIDIEKMARHERSRAEISQLHPPASSGKDQTEGRK
jgi:hypothetical protein